MRLNGLRLVCSAVTLLYVLPPQATLVPTLDLDRLTADATLIVVGQITSIQEVGRTTVQLGNGTVPARAMIAELRADHVLKGATESSSPSLKFHFALPDEFIGWRSVTPQSYRIYFLGESSGELQPVNPYYPSLVAVPGTEIQEGTAIERVIAQLSAVLESTIIPVQERREAVYALNSTKNPAVVRTLKHSAEVKDVSLRISVAAALLEHNDISTLQFAEDTLLKPDPTVSLDLLHNLSYAIFIGVKDERAVPSLTRLLHASSIEARRAAASALVHTGSKSSIAPLLSALSDPDLEIRYYSVVGLAEITGQTEWRPNMADFRDDQERYLKHWKQWAQNR